MLLFPNSWFSQTIPKILKFLVSTISCRDISSNLNPALTFCWSSFTVNREKHYLKLLIFILTLRHCIRQVGSGLFFLSARKTQIASFNCSNNWTGWIGSTFSFSWWSVRYSNRLYDFTVTIPSCCKDVLVLLNTLFS